MTGINEHPIPLILCTCSPAVCVRRNLTRHPTRPNFNVCHTHSLLRRRAQQSKGYLRMRKILIKINFYFVTKIWQMRNVSTKKMEKIFFFSSFSISVQQLSRRLILAIIYGRIIFFTHLSGFRPHHVMSCHRLDSGI